MKYALGLALFFTLSLQADDQFVKTRGGLMIILDVSGSMSGAPIQGVRNSLATAVKTMDKGSPIGLVSFSGCAKEDVKLEVPLEEADGQAQKVVDRANALEPTGATDIVGGILLGASEVKRKGSSYCIKVLLLTDGFDTCGNSGVQDAVKSIISQNEGCNQIHTVTIGVPAYESKIFEEISDLGNGTLTALEDAKELETKIEELMKKVMGKRDATNPGWKGDYSGKPDTGNKDDKKPSEGDPEKDPEKLKLKLKEKEKKSKSGGSENKEKK